jgi:hypothetical protein
LYGYPTSVIHALRVEGVEDNDPNTRNTGVDDMIDVIALPDYVQAAILIGVVLAEAVALYAGYGALEDVLAPAIIETIEQV